eukprot:scaffold270_cov390-Prasinococcus_capsulatus_cf.AAC.14
MCESSCSETGWVFTRIEGGCGGSRPAFVYRDGHTSRVRQRRAVVAAAGLTFQHVSRPPVALPPGPATRFTPRCTFSPTGESPRICHAGKRRASICA